MKVSVVGMGYVGIPVALILAESGNDVIGLDIDEKKIESLNNGHYPIEGNEPGIHNLLEKTLQSGNFSASLDFSSASDSDVWIVCVQTPFKVEEFEPNFQALGSAIESISKNLKKGALVVIESTVPPGTTTQFVVPIIEEISGLSVGSDFLIGHCPERVMPGKLITNLTTYGRAMGGFDANSLDKMEELYSMVTFGDLERMDIITAEVVKTFENTYRDVEIAIANDFAKYCDEMGVDFFNIRDIVNTVESRNLHLPGGGVGGHCIPKDTWLLAYGSRGKYTPELLLKAREVNDSMPKYVAKRTLSYLSNKFSQKDPCKIAILGLSYLGESDDTRNSPTVELVRCLESENVEILVHDHIVRGNQKIPFSSNLGDTVKGSDVVILMVAHKLYSEISAEYLSRLMRGKLVIDARNVFSVQEFTESTLELYSLGRGAI